MKLSTTAVAAATFSMSLGTAMAQDFTEFVPDSVLRTVGELLPEASGAGAGFADGTSPTNLRITESCSVNVTMLNASAGYQNSLGYFTYRVESNGSVTVLSSDLLFPKLKMQGNSAPVKVGTGTWLKNGTGATRTFELGERIGFFLIADGARRSDEVATWSYSPGIPSSDPTVNAGIGRGLYTSIASLNPETVVGDGSNAGHAAAILIPGDPSFRSGRELLVFGMEDLNRTQKTDDDFNDAVFLVEATPNGAIAREFIALAVGDPDGDGVSGSSDLFPNDASRAYQRRSPSFGHYIVAFEDLYPLPGDGDYNDAVFAIAFTYVTNNRNRIKDIQIDCHLVGRGASFEHSFGLHMPGLRSSWEGSVKFERFDSGDTEPQPVEMRDLAVVIAADSRRMSGIFSSTRTALPAGDPNVSPFANTEVGSPLVTAASTRLRIEFDSPVRSNQLGSRPFDFYLVADDDMGTVADIHLPAYSSFSDLRSEGLPTESGNNAFIDENGNPWALVIPSSWRFPLEAVPITRAYPNYERWRSSGGREARDWYEFPTVEEDKVSAPIEDLIVPRDWTLVIER